MNVLDRLEYEKELNKELEIGYSDDNIIRRAIDNNERRKLLINNNKISFIEKQFYKNVLLSRNKKGINEQGKIQNSGDFDMYRRNALVNNSPSINKNNSIIRENYNCDPCYKNNYNDGRRFSYLGKSPTPFQKHELLKELRRQQLRQNLSHKSLFDIQTSKQIKSFVKVNLKQFNDNNTIIINPDSFKEFDRVFSNDKYKKQVKTKTTETSIDTQATQAKNLKFSLLPYKENERNYNKNILSTNNLNDFHNNCNTTKSVIYSNVKNKTNEENAIIKNYEHSNTNSKIKGNKFKTVLSHRNSKDNVNININIKSQIINQSHRKLNQNESRRSSVINKNKYSSDNNEHVSISINGKNSRDQLVQCFITSNDSYSNEENSLPSVAPKFTNDKLKVLI